MTRRIHVLILVLFLAACGGDDKNAPTNNSNNDLEIDLGAEDAGSEDAGSDDAGLVDMARVDMAAENTPPEPPTVAITPANPSANVDLVCEITVEATDADGDELSVEFRWEVDGTLFDETTDTVAADETSPDEEWTCFAVVSDGEDSAESAQSTARIVNALPSAPTVTITPAAATTTDDLDCDATGSIDPDGEDVTYAYRWLVDGSDSGVMGTSLAASNTTKGEVWTCEATPSDPWGDGASAMADRTIENTPPRAPSATVSPSAPTTTDELNCLISVASTDADGDTLTYTYQWFRDGTAMGLTVATLAASDTAKGESWSCQATPNDGEETGPPGDSAPVTILNTAPVVSNVSVGPTDATVLDTLTCTPTASDADSDSLTFTYAWSVDGSPVSATTATLAAPNFAKGDVVSCTATADDGAATDDRQSNLVTIQNTAPTTPMVTISPVPANQAVDLTCTASGSTDVDGDSITYSYTWLVDGASSGNTTNTVSAADTDIGEAWQCQAVAYDGTSNGPMASDVINIVDSCGDGVIDPGEDCDDQNTDPSDGCNSSCQSVTCTTLVVNEFDGSTTYSRLVPNDTPQNAYLRWITSSKGIQAVGSKLDNLVVTDGSGNVLYSDNFTTQGSWVIQQGAIGTTDISGGTANAGSDWNIFGLGGVLFDTSADLIVTADVMWTSTTSSFGFYLVDVDPAVSASHNELLGGRHDLRLYGSGTGPAVSEAFDTFSGVRDVGYSFWIEPPPGWYEMSVQLYPSCSCGDGILDFGEACDDGNLVDGDGCSSICEGPSMLGTSCLDILTNFPGATDGTYLIDIDGTGPFPVREMYCDMTTDGGGWTRVINVTADSVAHDAPGAYGDLSDSSQSSKLSDADINAMSTLGYWRWFCGNSYRAFVTNASQTFTSAKVNSEMWQTDRDRDGTFECTANRSGYTFSDALDASCSAGHTNYIAQGGASEGTGCHVNGEGWSRPGTLWVK